MKVAESLSELKVEITRMVMDCERRELLQEIYAILLNASREDARLEGLTIAEEKKSGL